MKKLLPLLRALKLEKNSTDELEAELEMDLDNLKLDDIDTTDVNLDDEDLLED